MTSKTRSEALNESQGTVDAFTAEVIRSALVAITSEMKTNLMRTAYHTIIYEAEDFTVGLFDADGNSYIDYVGSWGPLILGHRHPRVTAALGEVLRAGTSFGAPTEREVEIAELIRELVPSMDMVRLVNSGTEATMSAIRVARGFTGRDLVVKFIGCYHGHVDSLLVKAGSGLATLGISDSAGVPQAFTSTTIPLPFNSVEALNECFTRFGDKIARIAAPTLYVSGADDHLGGPPPIMQRLADTVPGGRHVSVADAAHICNLQNPTGFNAVLSGFLRAAR